MSDALARRDQPGAAAARETGAAPSFDLQDAGWDWRPDGQIVARGTLRITRGDDSRPVVLNFELPLNGIPPMPAMRNPRDWVVNSLRRALRR